MRFYTGQHRHYCGVDLHARSMYVCVLEQALRAHLAAEHGKGKSLAIIAAKLARAVYFMLKRREPFDPERFFAH